MNPILTTALAATVLALAACQAPPPRVTLDCTAKRGQLDRVSTAADGKSCLYRTKDGSELTLRLLPVTGSPEETLKPFEVAPDSLAPSSPAPPHPDAAAAKAQAEAHADAGKAEDEDSAASNSAQIDLPGIHIDAHDKGASVEVGGLKIDAKDGRAIVKRQKDVRLRGEQLSTQRRGFRASFIWAGDTAADGVTATGYEAGGRRSGPLAVATYTVRGDDDADNIRKSATKLVRRNGGV